MTADEATASNRYAVIGRLGGGGMADIFLARSTSAVGIERYVVLKRVLAERSSDQLFASLLLEEARLAVQLQHPNIAQVLDVGKLGGAYFFTMEYVHGEDVRRILQRSVTIERPLEVGRALAIATGALAGLHHAHTRADGNGTPLGVVHRDVSPSNIMVSYEGGVKLLDFGVAKVAKLPNGMESSPGQFKGKVEYASPEQCRGVELDHRSDIFSLGIVLWEMLAGRRLFKADAPYEAMTAIVTRQAPLLAELRADVPPSLDALVQTALAKDREQRFQTAAAMIDAIEELAARERIVLSSTGLGKLLRELFGERKEPWLERRAMAAARMLTLTGESVADIDTGSVKALTTVDAGPHYEELAIAEQLDRAPQLRHGSEDPLSSPSSALPPRGESISITPPRGVTARGRRAIAIAVSAAVAATVVMVIVMMTTSSGTPTARPARPAAGAGTIAAPPAPAPAPPAPAPAPPTPAQAASVPADAAPVEPPPVDAALSPPPVVPSAAVPAKPSSHPKPRDRCADQRYRNDNPLKCQ